METYTIVMELSNSAFDYAPSSEVARILEALAQDVREQGPRDKVLQDHNGNTVGHTSMTVNRASTPEKLDPLTRAAITSPESWDDNY